MFFPSATEGGRPQGRGKCRGGQEGEGCWEEQPLGAMEMRGSQIVWFFEMG